MNELKIKCAIAAMQALITRRWSHVSAEIARKACDVADAMVMELEYRYSVDQEIKDLVEEANEKVDDGLYHCVD